ncbi:MAG: 4-aminobutyrate transaminase [Burkholderiales bacterium RIFCSPLOWO2_12_67_14]|nr:MAG: 4-aminobutyrate transaminase [Burkholderiales bacterium RIFCSPLOWO2_02_FULL_67_64]OGB41297.1 MAG: 4-aminobutyrate transaminase [Burkholderiales bacterium RIFCSPHIGHO2_12_FULL_67_38]OGB42560.1 MAG: 4-aminobutyrate transaminase [Burkholderiales bacterium RIFCSPLOWO2_12_67_14]OGB75500.1 MAG: 4-aminobutyrate transaminase [Burkholderiales bacterium RIFCSPLOWO2_12_FULL_67_210]
MNAPHTNAAWHQRRLDATPRGVGVMGDFFIDHAKNAELWDIEGRRFIDFAGGIAVLNTGHVHPKVQAAIAAQLQRFTHSCYQVVPYAEYVALAERINAIVPIEGQVKTAFFSTGAEAIENAIKIARSSTGRSGVIAFGGAFHGRSLFAVSLTGKVQPYKAGFGPFPPEIYHVPFPAEGASLDETKRAMDHVFKCDIEPSRVAAIIFEPVQGEGGFNPIQKEAVLWLRQLCDQHGILLIADEVQTGFARTGRMFAMERYGVSPDLMTLAKSMAGGTTLSAVCGKAAIMDGPAPGGLGGTYAGNPLAIAAAHAVLDVMAEEQLPERAQRLGARLVAHLNGAKAKYARIGDVRGLGAMVACEFVDAAGAPDADTTKRVQAAALKRGLLLLTCGVYGNVIRYLFPLTIEDSVFAEALGVLDAAMAETLA